MSIAIDKEKCIGCSQCISICPGSLIKLGHDKKAYIKYPKDCWACCSCLKECNQCAISLYLGADIGGRGSSLTVSQEAGIVHWAIKRYDGTVHCIDVNPKDSNKY